MDQRSMKNIAGKKDTLKITTDRTNVNKGNLGQGTTTIGQGRPTGQGVNQGSLHNRDTNKATTFDRNTFGTDKDKIKKDRFGTDSDKY